MWAGVASLAGAAWLASCASGSSESENKEKLYVPDDMPEICRDIDFTQSVDLRKTCGVQSHEYLAYRNIPEHRNLRDPKAGVIIKKDEELQLRLENFLPIDLPPDFKGKIRFGENVRREILRSQMEYVEYFKPEASRPDRLIRISIPLDVVNDKKAVCYTVERPLETQQRKTGYASKLLPMQCTDFDRIKAKTTPPSR
jgi:hypothetical protein